MKKIYLICLLTFLVVSCGKSPFLMKSSIVQNQISNLEVKKSFKTTDQLISTHWLSGINTSEEGRVLIILTKNNTLSDLSDYTISPYLWMESMGHGSSPIKIIRVADGIFELSEIYFSMPGDWQLHLQLLKNNEAIDEVVFKYNLQD